MGNVETDERSISVSRLKLVNSIIFDSNIPTCNLQKDSIFGKLTV